MGKDIDRHVNLFVKTVGKSHSFFHFFYGKIVGKGPEAKHFSAQINRVGPVEQGHAEFFHIACRGQKLRLLILSHFASSL